MHGGGRSAPKGNKNALKHGGFTKEALTGLAELRGLIAEVKKLVSK